MIDHLVLIGMIIVSTHVGWASQYAPGVMEGTIAVRQRLGQLPEQVEGYDGYVAVQDCEEIGDTIWLRVYPGGEWERFLVADCASRLDRQSETDARSGYDWMRSQNIIVEVDYETALRWDTVGYGIKVQRATSVIHIAKGVAEHAYRPR